MQLADRLAGKDTYAPLMSFAGRTDAIRKPSIPHRSGGFGGVEGLQRFLSDNAISAVVDATHPFAVRMSANARIACETAHLPLAVLTRPAWARVEGDDWTEVDDFAAAAAALGDEPRTVFLAIGRQEVGAFRGGTAHRYVVRSVDAADPKLLPGNARVVLARGPFVLADEVRLLQDERVDVVVSKNSGGDGAYAKIAAARQLGLPVIMIRRPNAGRGGDLHDVDAAVAWLEALRVTHDAAS